MNDEIQNDTTEYTAQDKISDTRQDWRADLPPDLQPFVKGYNDLAGFVRSYVDTKNFVGKKFEEFSRSDFQKFQSVMSDVNNIPVSPEAYAIDPTPVDGGESFLTEEDTITIKELSHRMGLNNDQAQIIHDVADTFVNRILEANQNEVNIAHENCLRDLAGAWGNAWESKIQAVENAIVNILPQFLGTDSESIKEELAEVQIYNSPIILKTLAFLGEMMSESSSAGYNNVAPADAQSRFENMRRDPEFMKARLNPHHPLHNQVVEEFRSVCEYANN